MCTPDLNWATRKGWTWLVSLHLLTRKSGCVSVNRALPLVLHCVTPVVEVLQYTPSAALEHAVSPWWSKEGGGGGGDGGRNEMVGAGKIVLRISSDNR